MTFRQKWDNYWYYYKIHTFAGIFVLVLLITTLVQCAQSVDTDLHIAYVSSVYTDTSALEEAAAKTVGDLNQDGHEKVFCDNLTIPDEPQTEADLMMSQKLMLLMVSGETRLFIMDKAYFEMEAYSDMFVSLEGVLQNEQMLAQGIGYDGKVIAVRAGDCPYLTELGIKGEDLYVGVVAITPANEKMKNIDKLYAASIELMRSFAGEGA